MCVLASEFVNQTSSFVLLGPRAFPIYKIPSALPLRPPPLLFGSGYFDPIGSLKGRPRLRLVSHQKKRQLTSKNRSARPRVSGTKTNGIRVINKTTKEFLGVENHSARRTYIGRMSRRTA